MSTKPYDIDRIAQTWYLANSRNFSESELDNMVWALEDVYSILFVENDFALSSRLVVTIIDLDKSGGISHLIGCGLVSDYVTVYGEKAISFLRSEMDSLPNMRSILKYAEIPLLTKNDIHGFKSKP